MAVLAVEMTLKMTQPLKKAAKVTLERYIARTVTLVVDGGPISRGVAVLTSRVPKMEGR